MEKQLSGKDLLIYPNPAKSNFRIITPDDKGYRLLIISTNGQTVYKTDAVKQNSMIDTTKFSNGLYIVYIIGKERTYSKKLLIER